MSGRKTRLTREIIEILSGALAKGATIQDACDIARISTTSYYVWLQYAEWCETDGAEGKEKPDGISEAILTEYADAVRLAKAKSYAVAINEIRRAGTPFWVHDITGQVLYKQPPPVTWMHTETGEIRFKRPGNDIKYWKKMFSGECWTYNEGKWQAQAWYLERSDKANWGKSTEIRGGEDAPPIGVTVYLPDNQRE